jgi:hypothetical protein
MKMSGVPIAWAGLVAVPWTSTACKPVPVEPSVFEIVSESSWFQGLALDCAGTATSLRGGDVKAHLSIRTSPQVCLEAYSAELGGGLGLDTADQVICIPEVDPCPGEVPLGDTCIHEGRAYFFGEGLGPFEQLYMVINASEEVSTGGTWTGRSVRRSGYPLGPLVVGTYTLEDGGCTAFALTPY